MRQFRVPALVAAALHPAEVRRSGRLEGADPAACAAREALEECASRAPSEDPPHDHAKLLGNAPVAVVAREHAEAVHPFVPSEFADSVGGSGVT